MDEIDRMDLPGFLRIRAWNARQKQKKKEPRRRYICLLYTSQVLAPVVVELHRHRIVGKQAEIGRHDRAEVH